MKFDFSAKIVALLFLLLVQVSFAQETEGNIGSEVVDVVKPYSASVSDAAKVQETPNLDDDVNDKKEVVKYSIFSFPVASTFTPAKGKAQQVEKEKKQHLFDNYASLGIGNYMTLNGELFVNKELENNDYVGGMLRHYSTQGQISGVAIDDWCADTSFDVLYGADYDGVSWGVHMGYQNKVYNWYGMPESFGASLDTAEKALFLSGIKPTHLYNNFGLGGKVSVTEGVFREAEVKFHHFADDYNSSENRFLIKPSLQLEIAEQSVKTDIIIDNIKGSFEKNYLNSIQALNYSYTNLGLSPSFSMVQDDWTLNIGAAIFYSIDNEYSDNKFYVYPNVTASYNVVSDLMIFYAGAQGGLEQNSYRDFADENPFLSPSLAIMPTDKQYDLFGGLKGKLLNYISYNIRGSILSEANKALYKSNDYFEHPANENYEHGNSFQVVYDDMRTYNFEGNLNADFADYFSFGLGGSFSSYKTNYQEEAWNLPTIQLNSTIDFKITSQWFAGVKLFYMGERKDQKLNTDIVYVQKPDPINLEAYFDLNAHLGYKYSEQLTGFMRFNNIIGNSYQRWLDYRVQGFQFVFGANYKFDF